MWRLRPKPVSEIDRFIDLLSVACKDDGIYAALEQIIAQPDDRRVALIQRLVMDMRKAEAPQDFVAAIACLVDAAVAEKAYEVIFKCRK